MEKLRFIDFGRVPVQKIMSYNEALFRTAEKTGVNVGFIWTTPPAIIMGYSQLIEKELNLDRCDALGYQVTRRISGGGMAFSSERSQIQYGYIGQLSGLPFDVTESYKEVCGIVIRALEKYSLVGEFKPINDVLCNGKKISGSAQTRGENVLLQHGTLLVDFNVKEMLTCCNIPLEKISDKGIASVEERMIDLNRVLGRNVPLDDAARAIRYGFEKTFDAELKDGALTVEEEKLASELLPKYFDQNWVFRYTQGKTRSKGAYPDSPEQAEFLPKKK
ncbi:MAG: biotin/lipoate A/B protein ligase family protein [Candidatus Altiarchaeia archaeon]